MADQKVNFTVTDLKSIVLKLDPDHEKRDVVYEFKNGRKFYDNDINGQGLYQTPS